MKKKKSALTRVNSILKKTERANTPRSIKNKLKKKEKPS